MSLHRSRAGTRPLSDDAVSATAFAALFVYAVVSIVLGARVASARDDARLGVIVATLWPGIAVLTTPALLLCAVIWPLRHLALLVIALMSRPTSRRAPHGAFFIV
jgi:hypothetical protein